MQFYNELKNEGDRFLATGYYHGGFRLFNPKGKLKYKAIIQQSNKLVQLNPVNSQIYMTCSTRGENLIYRLAVHQMFLDTMVSNMRVEIRIIDSVTDCLSAFMGDFKQLVGRIDTLEKDVEHPHSQRDELQRNLDHMEHEMARLNELVVSVDKKPAVQKCKKNPKISMLFLRPNTTT